MTPTASSGTSSTARRAAVVVALFLFAAACDSGSPDPVEPTSTGDRESPSDTEESIHVQLSPADATSVPLGEPFRFAIVVRNDGDRSVSVAPELSLVGPDRQEVAFLATSVFVPSGEEVAVPSAVTSSQWFSGTGPASVVVAVEDREATDELTFEVTAATTVVPRFTDVTEAAGLTTEVPAAECGQFVSGAAWADVDGDGVLDLALTRLGEPTQLFLGDGDGRFDEDGAARGFAHTDANGVSFADYDDDGDLDAFLTRDGSDLLLRNDGSGRFVDVSAEAGIGDPGYRGVSAAWADFDADGHLDLHVTNYMRCTGEWRTEAEIIDQVEYFPDQLYRNNGDGTFEDVTEVLENDPDDPTDGFTMGAGFAAAWVDVDGDGRLDLHLANDFVGPSPDHNRLWLNDGPADGSWRFTDVSVESGAALFMNAMGFANGDVDRDGDVDVAISNIGANKLLRNDGDGTFTEDTASGIERSTQVAGLRSVTWGGGFADLNLDGWLDLVFAAGNLMDSVGQDVGPQPNQIFVNDGTGRFLDVSAATGAGDPGDGKGVAIADYDRDGDLDLLVVNQGGTPRLFRNDTPAEGHWLAVDVTGSESPRDACGASIAADDGTGPQTRAVDCGSSSVASGSRTPVHFGFAAGATEVDLEIAWPSGRRDRIESVSIDQFVHVEESDL